jgi:hypothetical protein
MGGFRPFSLDRPRHNEIAGAALDMLRPKGEGGGHFGGVGIKLQGSMECLIKKFPEDEEACSPQYPNDIEHDRRSPSSDRMVQQFADALNFGPLVGPLDENNPASSP